MCGVEVSRILFLEHHSTCAVEKLGATVGKRTRFLSDLAKQAQGQRILVDVLEPAACEMVQNEGSVDRREFIRQEDMGIIALKGLEVKQHRGCNIIILYFDAVGRAPPVGFAARQDEGRIAHC